jgi:hypothetical protein
MHQLLATLCVASSLALVALDDSNPCSGFQLQTLSFSRPPSYRGLIGDTMYASLVSQLERCVRSR